MEQKRIFDLLYRQANTFPKEVALAHKVNGSWKEYSTQDFIEIVNKLSIAFIKKGISKGDKIAIISQNRPEWNFIDFACQQLGAVSVPMYPTITVEDYKYIFNDSEVKLVFVSDEDLLRKATLAAEGNQTISGIFTFDHIPNSKHWTSVMELGENEDVHQLESYKGKVEEEDLLTLIYTSGTTGTPKGVMLTHKNLLTNTVSVSEGFPVVEGKSRVISFLPMCHIYERMAIYLYIYRSASVYYAENMEKIGDNIKEIKPDFFTTVPRLLEKVYDKIVAKGHELSGLKRYLFFWALELGHKYDIEKNQGWWYNYQLKIANKIIFNKWREALGGNIVAIASGGAALQPRLARIFWAAQLPILEGYGLTETSPVITATNMEFARIGCVGKNITGVEVKIAPDGEVLTKGPNVMKGYYKNPELTNEYIVDGWFHTGDIGELSEDGFLKITDRKKEMFKTSGAKYVAPQVLENKFKESNFIEQIMVIGDGEKFPAALIVPNFVTVKEYCNHKDINYISDQNIIKNKDIIKKIEDEVEKYNEEFAQFEKVKKFELLSKAWTVESGELTPKMSLKRKIIFENNKPLIDKIYRQVVLKPIASS
jgi:long-chain acyl-CoA synthetase